MHNHKDCDDTCQAKIIEQAVLLRQLRTALVSDFKDLYTKEYTTDYRAKRIVQSIEIDLMPLHNTLKLIDKLVEGAKHDRAPR